MGSASMGKAAGGVAKHRTRVGELSASPLAPTGHCPGQEVPSCSVGAGGAQESCVGPERDANLETEGLETHQNNYRQVISGQGA